MGRGARRVCTGHVSHWYTLNRASSGWLTYNNRHRQLIQMRRVLCFSLDWTPLSIEGWFTPPSLSGCWARDRAKRTKAKYSHSDAPPPRSLPLPTAGWPVQKAMTNSLKARVAQKRRSLHASTLFRFSIWPCSSSWSSQGGGWIPRALIELIRASPLAYHLCSSFFSSFPSPPTPFSFVTYSMMIQPVADRLMRRFFVTNYRECIFGPLCCTAWRMIRRMVKFWGRVEVAFFTGLKTKVDEGCFDDLLDSMTVYVLQSTIHYVRNSAWEL